MRNMEVLKEYRSGKKWQCLRCRQEADELLPGGVLPICLDHAPDASRPHRLAGIPSSIFPAPAGVPSVTGEGCVLLPAPLNHQVIHKVSFGEARYRSPCLSEGPSGHSSLAF